jgi:hypothetical protein
MLSLDSPRWSELEHAYGAASDIPALLRRLDTLPGADGEQEPWFSLWSALAHQEDVYSASFAAVPHVVKALAADPARADSAYFHFPAWVEICRCKKSVAVPEELASAYFEALSQLPTLVAAAAARPWDASFLLCALSAIAVAKNQPVVAEAALELSPDVAEEFMEWFSSR